MVAQRERAESTREFERYTFDVRIYPALVDTYGSRNHGQFILRRDSASNQLSRRITAMDAWTYAESDFRYHLWPKLLDS